MCPIAAGPREVVMKVSIQIECTADEAREFMGLPNLKPLQTAMMATLEQQAVDAVERFAPDALLKFWFSAAPLMSGQMQDVASGLSRTGAAK